MEKLKVKKLNILPHSTVYRESISTDNPFQSTATSFLCIILSAQEHSNSWSVSQAKASHLLFNQPSTAATQRHNSNVSFWRIACSDYRSLWRTIILRSVSLHFCVLTFTSSRGKQLLFCSENEKKIFGAVETVVALQ